MSTIFVYDLIDPGEVTSKSGAITQTLSGAGLRVSDDFELTIAAESGAILATDHTALSRPVLRPTLPETPDAAATQSAKFLGRLRDGWRAAQRPGGAPFPNLFPLERLRVIECWLIEAIDGDRPPHWLVRWGLTLPSGRKRPGSAGSETIPVRGVTVETRIGSGDQPLSLTSTLRPWRAVRRLPLWDMGDHADDHALFYETIGIYEPLRFWAPFWLPSYELTVQDHHKGGGSGGHSHGSALRPASPLSLSVGIGWQADGTGVQLSCVQTNRQGQSVPLLRRDGWDIRWGWGGLGSPHGLSWVEDEVLRLEEPGVFHVCVVVEHSQTGATGTTFLELPVRRPDPLRAALA